VNATGKRPLRNRERKRREQATAKADAELEEARQAHDIKTEEIAAARAALDRQSDAEVGQAEGETGSGPKPSPGIAMYLVQAELERVGSARFSSVSNQSGRWIEDPLESSGNVVLWVADRRFQLFFLNPCI
jgi:hypothetical protein